MKKVYEENKKLELLLLEKYGENEGEVFIKNKLELLILIGQLANEVKTFRYKKQNYQQSLEKYANCFMMVLIFMTSYKLELHETQTKSIDLDELFIKLFEMTVNVEDNIASIYSHFLLLGNMLGFSRSEIESAVLKKIELEKERIEEKK